MSVVEFGFLPLQPGVALEADESESGKKLDEIRRLTVESAGIQGVFSGRTVEKNEVGVTVRVWESLQAQQANAQSDARAKVRGIIATLLAGAPTTYTITGSSADVIAPLKAPVTEIFERYYDADQADSIASQVADASAKFLKALLTLPGALAASDGWSTETIEKDGKKVKVFVLVIGWETVDAHMQARSSSLFAEVVPLIREGAPLGTSMVHVPFKPAE